jgi:TatD DNase family protein
MEYIDIHSHLSFQDYKRDLLGVLINMRANNVATIAVGSDYKSSAEAVELASQNPDVFACVGLHPDEDKAEIFDIKKYEELVQKQKVVAVGECGLDYFHLGENPIEQIKKQKEIFSAQIALAKKYNKPLMFHIRDAVNNPAFPKGQAYYDVLEMLKENKGVTGNVHFFAGSWAEAEQFLNLGFTLSFTGVITFARSYDEVIKKAPLNMIMAETDAPYVAPVPFRGKRNEPAYVTEVVKKIAEIRGEDQLWVKHQLVENAKRVFKINL